jgi:hypothetical protein
MFGPPLFYIFFVCPPILGPHLPPLLQACVSPPGTKGGDPLTCGLSGWGPNSDDWRESLALCLLCGPVDQCANILAHRCPPPPIGNDDQARCANNFFFLFGPPPLLAQGASVRQWEWRNIRKMLVFRAPRLFSCQSPIN